MTIRISSVTKRFGAFTALDGIDLEIPPGQLVALLGPSGSGKTTLLRIIAGLESPDSGTVELPSGSAKRRVGFVFQHYALFKHLTVAQNVAFGLSVRPRRERPSKAAIQAKVDEVLGMVQLAWAGERYPDQLSGGQRQRVALARALAIEPEVLLLDEPFGALDAQVRTELRQWIRRLHDQTGLTSVFVTHDQEEAMEVADRIVVVRDGRIEQDGSPREVYERPASPFVYRFIGQANRLQARVEGGALRLGTTALALAEAEAEHPEGARLEGYLRPHELALDRESGPGALPAVVRRIQAMGILARVRLQALHDGSDLEAHLPADELARLELSVGQQAFVTPRRLALFPEPGEVADWCI